MSGEIKNALKLKPGELVQDGTSYKLTGDAVNGKPSVLFVMAPWCGHCKAIKGNVEKVASYCHQNIKSMDEVNHCNVFVYQPDLEPENKHFSGILKVRGFPSILHFHPNGNFIKEHSGSREMHVIFDELMKSSGSHDDVGREKVLSEIKKHMSRK